MKYLMLNIKYPKLQIKIKILTKSLMFFSQSLFISKTTFSFNPSSSLTSHFSLSRSLKYPLHTFPLKPFVCFIVWSEKQNTTFCSSWGYCPSQVKNNKSWLMIMPPLAPPWTRYEKGWHPLLELMIGVLVWYKKLFHHLSPLNPNLIFFISIHL